MPALSNSSSRHWLLLAFFVLTVFSSRATPVNEDAERLVIITSGDTFASISLREFGSSGFGRLIAEYNKLNYKNSLRAGEIIRLPIAVAPGNEFARVVFTKGEPFLFPRGDMSEQRGLKNGSHIFAGDIIKTSKNGYVSVLVPSGTTVTVQPDSLVQLVKLDCLEQAASCVVEVDASLGKVTSTVRRSGGKPTSFRVRTPHALAAVRGTVFDIDASAEVLLVSVTEGELDLRAQGKTTGLVEGLGSKTLAGQPPGEPVRLLPVPRFLVTPGRRLSTEDTIVWRELDKAVSYQLSINGDEIGAAVEHRTVLDDLVYQVPQVKSGSYFLSLRGIDADGFVGFSAQLPVLAIEVDESITQPILQQVQNNDEIFVSVEGLPDPDASYEIQISETRDFHQLTTVDVSGDGGLLYHTVSSPAFARARKLNGEISVGQFGPVLELPANL